MTVGNKAVAAYGEYGRTVDVFDAGAQVGEFMRSGIGRELNEFALPNYAELKTASVKL
jgi:hypothetical protein